MSSAVPFPGCGAPRYDGAGALAALDVEAVYVTPAARELIERLQAAGALAPDASWRAAADLVGDPPGAALGRLARLVSTGAIRANPNRRINQAARR